MPPQHGLEQAAPVFALYSETERGLEILPYIDKAPAGSLAIRLEYLAEGGANVVYKIRTEPVKRSRATRHRPSTAANGHRDIFSVSNLVNDRKEGVNGEKIQNEVLRLRKVAGSSQHHYVSTTDIETHLDEVIATQLGGRQWIIPSRKIRVHPKVIAACNKDLVMQQALGHRPRKRFDSALEESESFGLLMESMLGVPGRSFTLQFKPKWLSHSPNATPSAKRCRTCALKAMRGVNGRTPVGKVQCPRNLVGDHPSETRLEMLHVLDANGMLGDLMLEERLPDVLGHLTEHFHHGKGRTILNRLASLQAQLDPLGIVKLMSLSGGISPQQLKDLQLAMTLRDCSVYVRYSWDGGLQAIETHLGDLDPKEGEMKLGAWCRIETLLLQGGWYDGTEELAEGQRQHRECSLWDPSQHTKRCSERAEGLLQDINAGDAAS